MRSTWLPLVTLALCGCVTAPPTTSSVPRDTGDVCASHCKSLGMDLGAVVIVRNSTGCVCQPRGAAPRASGGPGAAMGGVVAFLDEVERQQQEYRYQQQYWQQQTRTRTGSVNKLGGWRPQ